MALQDIFDISMSGQNGLNYWYWISTQYQPIRKTYWIWNREGKNGFGTSDRIQQLILDHTPLTVQPPLGINMRENKILLLHQR